MIQARLLLIGRRVRVGTGLNLLLPDPSPMIHVGKRSESIVLLQLRLYGQRRKAGTNS